MTYYDVLTHKGWVGRDKWRKWGVGGLVGGRWRVGCTLRGFHTVLLLTLWPNVCSLYVAYKCMYMNQGCLGLVEYQMRVAYERKYMHG